MIDLALLFLPNLLQAQVCRGQGAYQGITVFASEHNARTFNFSAGDVGVVPFAYGHYIENTSADLPLCFLEVFKSPQFHDVSLNQWIALTPPELVKEHLDLSDKVIKSIRKEKWPFVK